MDFWRRRKFRDNLLPAHTRPRLTKPLQDKQLEGYNPSMDTQAFESLLTSHYVNMAFVDATKPFVPSTDLQTVVQSQYYGVADYYFIPACYLNLKR